MGEGDTVIHASAVFYRFLPSSLQTISPSSRRLKIDRHGFIHTFLANAYWLGAVSRKMSKALIIVHQLCVSRTIRPHTDDKQARDPENVPIRRAASRKPRQAEGLGPLEVRALGGVHLHPEPRGGRRQPRRRSDIPSALPGAQCDLNLKYFI